ncbi:single-stranded DNA-binding protein [Sporosarcina sp. Sa2YVA2]|uniref:Single-stranded DNA-binding protein n=1 Tax=Sporosarcina quadrami TaxID=2762234 RepID=A0ABR8U8S0_9BACL|nr:single-stranded DNA-binding protein [Sporosarcina quadrami]MBD7984437.1 single-stranded DNA-binding protein [Sporosarcina quadrami]
MINSTVLVGRLTKDPELKYSQGGVAICRFTLAVNRTFKTQDGKDADFIQIVCFNKQAENVSNFLSKGSLAGVEGRIQTGSYDGQDGKRVYTTEVIADSVQFLEPKRQDGQTPQQNQQNYQRQDNDPFQNTGAPIEVSDEDLPF